MSRIDVKFIQLTVFVIAFLVAQPGHSGHHQASTIQFGFDDRLGLIAHFKAQGYNARPGEECCQPDEDALGIWIGREVPIEDVRYVITQAIQSYPHLVYYAYFGSEGDNYPDSLDHAIYIGGSKRAVMCHTVAVPAEVALQIFGTISSRHHLEYFLNRIQTKDETEMTESSKHASDRSCSVLEK